MSAAELSEDIRCHFHLFWDHFPYPVLVIHENRTILACNPKAEEVGVVVGTRCIDQGNKEMHKNCLANHALNEQTTKRTVSYLDHVGMVADSYWVPLAGRRDVYLHFSIDITEHASERFFPKSCDDGTASCDSRTGELHQ